jgi:hypothetical protein
VGLPSSLFLSGFPTITMYTPLLLPIHTTCPTHLILLDFITQTVLGEDMQINSKYIFYRTVQISEVKVTL